SELETRREGGDRNRDAASECHAEDRRHHLRSVAQNERDPRTESRASASERGRYGARSLPQVGVRPPDGGAVLQRIVEDNRLAVARHGGTLEGKIAGGARVSWGYWLDGGPSQGGPLHTLTHPRRSAKG